MPEKKSAERFRGTLTSAGGFRWNIYAIGDYDMVLRPVNDSGVESTNRVFMTKHDVQSLQTLGYVLERKEKDDADQVQQVQDGD